MFVLHQTTLELFQLETRNTAQVLKHVRVEYQSIRWLVHVHIKAELVQEKGKLNVKEARGPV